MNEEIIQEQYNDGRNDGGKDGRKDVRRTEARERAWEEEPGDDQSKESITLYHQRSQGFEFLWCQRGESKREREAENRNMGGIKMLKE
jgi:hypothetical protein